jgi:hypothetical protein
MAEANIQHLAVSYRQLVLWVGLQLVLSLGSLFLGSVPVTVRLLPLLATAIALAYYAYKTAQALGSLNAWVWAAAMFVPWVSAVTLLILSSKATALCRANGIEVGLLGPRV